MPSWRVTSAGTGVRLRTRAALLVAALLILGTAWFGPPANGATSPGPMRIVAIGDLHGDLRATRAALRLAGAIDTADHWVGGRTVIVQTGDLLDRGNDEPAILALFERLAVEAAQAGGAVHVLNGNHELMNAYLDFRYVTDSGFRSFHPARDTAGVVLPAKVTPAQRERALAFRPGGQEALLLAAHPVILVLGDNVFVHGGVLPVNARLGVDSINAQARAWLEGKAPQPAWVRGKESPVWNRVYSKQPDAAACAMAREALAILDLKRMVVGHSIQKQGITAYCDAAVWAIDVGMSAFAGGPIQVLEIRGDSVHVLKAEG